MMQSLLAPSPKMVSLNRIQCTKDGSPTRSTAGVGRVKARGRIYGKAAHDWGGSPVPTAPST